MSKKIGVFIVVAVLVCAISMPIFAANTNSVLGSYVVTNTYSTPTNEGLGFSCQVTSYTPINVDEQYTWTGSGANDKSNVEITYSQTFHVVCRAWNNSTSDLFLDLGFCRLFLNLSDSSAYSSSSYKNATDRSLYISDVQGDLFCSVVSASSSSVIGLRWGTKYLYNSGLVVPSGMTLIGYFDVTLYSTISYAINNSYANPLHVAHLLNTDYISIQYPNSDSSVSVIDDYTLPNADYNTINIDENVQSILDAYTSNSANAQAVTDGTNSNEQTLAGIGQNEDTWFTQNNQALNSTGISNFSYTPTVMTGMSAISDKFNQLWIAIGDWNFVYTFAMMIGLVMLILRHAPQRKKGGGKNASSS